MGDAAAKQLVIGEEPFWAEVRRVIRPIAVDIVVFVVILSALLLGFVGLNALMRAGYDPQRIHALETMHYWSYAAIFALFAFDLIFKIFLALFWRSKEHSNDSAIH